MKFSFSQQCVSLLVFALFFISSCGPTEPGASQAAEAPSSGSSKTPLEAYMEIPDDAFTYEVKDSIKGEGYTAFIVRMVSQRWLTTAEVKDPTWWHWLTIVVPDEVITNKGMLFIGGGSRRSNSPEKADEIWTVDTRGRGADLLPEWVLHQSRARNMAPRLPRPHWILSGASI